MLNKIYINSIVNIVGNTVTGMKTFSVILLCLGLFLHGCATTRMVALQGEEGTVTPNGIFSIVTKDGFTISVSHVKTPYSIRGITTFFVQVYNNTDETKEFFPKPYILFDQNGTQYYAMGPNALGEAAHSGGYSRSHVGFGFGHGFYSGGFMHYYHGFSPYHYPPYVYGRTYRGMIAKALPVHPLTVHARSRVAGNVYFPVNPNRLENVEVLVTRFAEMPVNGQPEPRGIDYWFKFDVIN